MPEPITINTESAHFFISINKSDAHSFVMLGIYDQHKVTHLLCRVGKIFDTPNENDNDNDNDGFFTGVENCGAALFSSAKGRLNDEGTFRKRKGEDPISYQAYELSYQQYKAFIQLLEGLQTDKNKFKCYKPVEEKGSTVVLNLTSNVTLAKRKIKAEIITNTSEVRVGNTCRHTAIQLVEKAQQAPLSSLISNAFIKDLPYTTRLDHGVPSGDIPFYVLPVAPTACASLDEGKKAILFKLYSRMEHLLLIDTHSDLTKNKFQSLKDLYNEIAGPQKDLNLGQLLESIQGWKQANKDHLNVLRVTYFWDSFFTRESATSTLITEIEHDLQQTQPK